MMDIPRYEHYSMHIAWSDEDRRYIVVVPELPGCVTHGATYEEAVRQGQDAIDSWVYACILDGDPVPAPALFDADATFREMFGSSAAESLAPVTAPAAGT